MEKKIIFLLYDSRSGSTLLSALLNRYKGISVSQESTFIHRIIEFRHTIRAEQIEEIFHELSKEVQFNELDFDTETFITKIKKNRKGILSKKDLIEFILEDYFCRRDPHAVFRIVKQGDYLYMKEILEMFPDSIFLQIVRDGRAVFNSKKHTYSFEGELQDTNPLHAAWNWVQKLKKAEYYNDKIITVRFEDLLKDPEFTLNEVLNRLNLPLDFRKKTKPQEDYYRDLGKRQKPLHQNVMKQPQPDYIDKWRSSLSDKEIVVFNWWAKKYLEKYGYKSLDFTRLTVYFYSFHYLILFISNKTINLIKLLGNPGRVLLKLKRKFRMIIKS